MTLKLVFHESSLFLGCWINLEAVDWMKWWNVKMLNVKFERVFCAGLALNS